MYRKYKRNKKANNAILGFFCASLGYVAFFELVISLFGRENNHFFLVFTSYAFYPVLLLISPLIYMFVKSFSLNQQENLSFIQNIKHFVLPISLFVINIFSFFAFQNLDPESQNFKLLTDIITYLNFGIFFIVFLLQNIFYLILSWNEYFKHRQDFQIDKDSTLKTLNWIKYFIWSYCALLVFLCLFQMQFLEQYKIVFRFIVMGYVLSIVFLGLKDYDELQSETDMIENAKFELDDAVKQKIQKAFQVEVIENKIYLNQDISLQLLAQTLNTNTKYLSKYINQEYNMSFINLMNTLRVEEAKSILLDPTNKKFTLESVGAMSGFNSKSSFNSAFKKIVAMTPSEFREVHTLNMKGATP